MAVNFPASPTNNQIFTSGGITWSYSTSIGAWRIVPNTIQGVQGISGFQGTQGIQGTTGSQGIQGLQGTLGLQGIQGSGLQGIQGIQGIQGSGLQGIQGIQGISVQGLQGLQGPSVASAFAVKTANYTAVNGDRLLCNTTAGTFIVTLPASPASGAMVTIFDVGNFSTNPLTIARNASTIESIADDFSLDIGQTHVQFVYDGSTWHVFPTIGPRGLADTTTVASSIAYSIALG